MMTRHPVKLQVQGEGDATVRTAPNITAHPALNEICESAAIKEQQSLMSRIKIVFNGSFEFGGK
jgi:hypothetical protein